MSNKKNYLIKLPVDGTSCTGVFATIYYLRTGTKTGTGTKIRYVPQTSKINLILKIKKKRPKPKPVINKKPK